ncbi:hypothetical protein SDC9_41245 [bioreactor metagenome]|uniref:Treble clef zinc finger domain-containing protein n=1 Tax=bioreactor metagenome TaxID=1076179 RepID=A0A644VX83_9ZZZZ
MEIECGDLSPHLLLYFRGDILLLTKTVFIKWCNLNRKRYESLGYTFTKNGDDFEVNVSDLPPSSHAMIEWSCDCCGITKRREYRDYTPLVRDGKRYCHRCATRMNTSQKKCENAKLRGRQSFLEYHILNTDVEFSQKYVSPENTVDLNTLLPFANVKFLAICNNKSHPPYEVSCSDFTQGRRCPYCASKRILPETSLAAQRPSIQDIWSDKNSKSPFEYFPNSGKKVYFKCANGIHEDYQRKISASALLDFRCPQCSKEATQSILSTNVEYWLNANKFKFNKEYGCDILPINPKTNLPLPFDFELIEQKIIIEVHGQQHYQSKGLHREHSKRSGYSEEKELYEQQWRDAFKQKYALDHGYLYLPIPYWAQGNGLYATILGDALL